MNNDYEVFKMNILKYTGIDLNCYKEEQMKRRIKTLITKKSLGGLDEYYRKICSDKDEYEEFLSYMTINVSEFFRNPEQWKVLEEDILPSLLKRKNGRLKIWSAACSTGDEPYSLVMLLSKYVPFENIDILATDIDAKIIDKAKVGIYSESSLKNIPVEFRSALFEKTDMSAYRISDKVKSCVTFKQHDLIKDSYPTNMDLILCRNVLIYFTEDAKNEVYRKFYNAMGRDSTLFIGSTEQVIKYREIGFQVYKSFFYNKK